uniref:Partial AB-hydrolase lipase domain-containing protein n=2 Tax=Bombyx mori TaxID=7091 RepID=A0A8R1WG57_BOMMO|nr:lipase 3 [Bombyx mori]
MRNFTLIVIVIISTNQVGGQLIRYTLSSTSTTVSALIDMFYQLPIFSGPFRVAEDIISSGRGAITSLSGTVIHALGGHLPTLINKTILKHFDDIVADYHAGLGNEDITLSIEKIIEKYNHKVEKHFVTTEDQYCLTLFRIPNKGPAVFLMHGLLGSSDDFVVAGPEGGLAFLLTREGYDVWMGNARGNKHSKQHLILNPSDAIFWDFSWHEIGYYDLPAMIDYVLASKNTSSLKYIGYSQGTTTFFVMTSERPEYNEKISAMIALSPVAFMTKVRSPIVRLFTPGTPLIYYITKIFGIREFLPDNNLIRSLKFLLCGTLPLAEILCSNVIFLFTGFGYEQLNVTNLPVLYGHMPAGASVKQIVHFGQGTMSGDFKMFDYGYFNLKLYGNKEPPHYRLYKVVTPVYLFYSDEDWLAHPDDVEKLYSSLGNAKEMYKVPFEPFTHVDFIWGKDVKTLIYEKLKTILLSH